MNRRRIILLLVIIMITGVSAMAQKTSQSVGLKLGDPVGVTYKYYPGGDMAFEAVVGTVPRGWYNGYYSSAFYDDFDNARYLSHDVEFALALQARVMWQKSLEEFIPDSEWYWGVGANLRLVNLDYRYVTGFPDFTTQARSDVTNIDLGPEVFAGAEYFFREVPLTAFVELGIMLEIVDEMNLRLLGGGGIRYNF